MHIAVGFTNHFWFYIFMCVGVYSVTGPIYSSEMSPSHLRGKLGVLNILFSTTGGMVSIVVAGLLSIDSSFAYSYGWR